MDLFVEEIENSLLKAGHPKVDADTKTAGFSCGDLVAAKGYGYVVIIPEFPLGCELPNTMEQIKIMRAAYKRSLLLDGFQCKINRGQLHVYPDARHRIIDVLYRAGFQMRDQTLGRGFEVSDFDGERIAVYFHGPKVHGDRTYAKYAMKKILDMESFKTAMEGINLYVFKK